MGKTKSTMLGHGGLAKHLAKTGSLGGNGNLCIVGTWKAQLSRIRHWPQAGHIPTQEFEFATGVLL
jgi:hypothetical protein